MSKYIKLEDAIKEAKSWSMFLEDNLISRLGRLPSIDVVCCKDCKYQHSNGDGTGWCDRAIINGDEMSCVVANDDDYCSYGERKDG